ncbi:WG repeat-containing protein [Leptospira biflexa]|uniref:WG repeat-containing protein n=1 Tax=Leptospira biflexa TaxID=172 RepID=UPI001083B5F7|nr:WG repeat-containing protein [Leptospira biflexa]TGM35837.1 WG repeat-containing protein [Leptospira biflexa]TGM37207.1 WG repeat-containing protein [Leptospira biflexa]TGM56060.1 WG repeat-containing protein [Leptospira biflexa]
MNKHILLFLSLVVSGSLLAQTKGFISFEENGLYGFKDKKGNVMIKPDYQQAMEFTKSGVAFVVLKNKWVCINHKNNVLLESFLYDNGPDYISERLARFVENGKMGFHNERCQKVIKATYDFVYPFENGYAIVCNGCELKPEGEHKRIVGGLYGLINSKGKLVVPVVSDAILSVDAKKKTAEVKEGGKTGKVNWK